MPFLPPNQQHQSNEGTEGMHENTMSVDILPTAAQLQTYENFCLKRHATGE